MCGYGLCRYMHAVVMVVTASPSHTKSTHVHHFLTPPNHHPPTTQLQSCPITAQGLDGQAIPLKHTTVSGLHLQPAASDHPPITLVGPGSGRPSSLSLAVGDLPGLARLGLLDRPAMLVGMDVLDGDRGCVVLSLRASFFLSVCGRWLIFGFVGLTFFLPDTGAG